jgi:hypothetical protein
MLALASSSVSSFEVDRCNIFTGERRGGFLIDDLLDECVANDDFEPMVSIEMMRCEAEAKDCSSDNFVFSDSSVISTSLTWFPRFGSCLKAS